VWQWLREETAPPDRLVLAAALRISVRLLEHLLHFLPHGLHGLVHLLPDDLLDLLLHLRHDRLEGL
jgi:hypothetical protein